MSRALRPLGQAGEHEREHLDPACDFAGRARLLRLPYERLRRDLLRRSICSRRAAGGQEVNESHQNLEALRHSLRLLAKNEITAEASVRFVQDSVNMQVWPSA
jgi:hypothetical protein